MIRRRLLLALLVPVLVAGVAIADKKVKMTFKEYARRSKRATSKESYERAAERLTRIELGMKSHRFFTRMEMLYLKDKKGEPVDGFCEGHLRKESQQMTRGKSPDHYIVFGYYKNWKKKKHPVKKFYARFRHKVLVEIRFYDPADDVHRVAGKLSR